MPRTCSVFGCGSNNARDKISFHRFPSILGKNGRVVLPLAQERREKWINSLRRSDLTEKKIKYGFVCSKHFRGGKPSELYDKDNIDWVPNQNMGYYSTIIPKKRNALKEEKLSAGVDLPQLIPKQEGSVGGDDLDQDFIYSSCNSRSGKDKVNFYIIPKELHYKHRIDLNELSATRRQQWINAIKRSGLTEKKLSHSRVCSKHFVSGKPAELPDRENVDWAPTLFMGCGPDGIQLDIAKAPSIKHKRATIRKREHSNTKIKTESVEQIDSTDKNDKAVQTDISTEDAYPLKLEMGFYFFKDNDVKTKYYTGFNSFKKLEVEFSLVKNSIPIDDISLPAFEQFVLTLMKLRLNLDFEDLAFRFGTSPTCAFTCFKRNIEVMYEIWKGLIIWPQSEILTSASFNELFGDKLVAVIECFNVVTSSDSVKFLISMTPDGVINFISQPYKGPELDSIADNFLDKLTEGDIILADKGFLMDDNGDIPEMQAFTKQGEHLHFIELNKTSAFYDVKMHVDNITQRIKQKYRIISCNTGISEIAEDVDDPIIEKCITVCCALLNLLPPPDE